MHPLEILTNQIDFSTSSSDLKSTLIFGMQLFYQLCSFYVFMCATVMFCEFYVLLLSQCMLRLLLYFSVNKNNEIIRMIA